LAFSLPPPLPRTASSAEGKQQDQPGMTFCFLHCLRSSRIAWPAIGGCSRVVHGLYERLARIFAALVLIAAFAVPSLAFAHEGHQPLGAAKVVPALLETQAAKNAIVAVANVTVLSTARASMPVAVGMFTGCGGHCCGGSAGMACCGAALASDPSSIPLFRASLLFLIRDVPPPQGISPEALPKPPKSFA
jgi:hypothetical protein